MGSPPLSMLHTCFSSSWGGLEIQALDEAHQLARRHHDVTLACLPASRLEDEARQLGLKIHHVPATGYVHPVAAWQLSRFLRDARIQIIHCQLSRDIATVVPAMRLSGNRIPVILSRRMGSYIDKRDLFHRFTYSHVSRVLAISNVIHRNVLDTTPMTPDRVLTLHHAVDTERFSPARTDRAATRRSLGLSDTTVAIGFVGRFSHGKGHEEFLEAARLVVQTRPGTRFVIVGEASYGEEAYERKIRTMSSELGLDGVVQFTGFRRDIVDLMAAFDIFAFPSHAESFGAVLIEAMAMERPVVSTNCDGVLDIVVDRVTGIYVPPGDAQALASAFSTLIDDPVMREAMGKEGRRRVLEHFNQAKQMDRLEAIYREVLSAAPPGERHPSPSPDRHA